jgi:hypothetical protein
VRRAHLIVGALALAAFVLTGQYMDRVHAHLVGMPDGPRMLYRSAHIYLLFASLINLLLGAYLTRAAAGAARVLQTLGSVVLLTTPLLFLGAFAVEPGLRELLRPWARPGIYLSLAGVLAHVFAARAGAASPQSLSRSSSDAGREAARSEGASTGRAAP